MASSRFSCFAELPVELRLLVWNLVSFPERVVGLVPYAKQIQDGGDFDTKDSPHFVRVVQPSHSSIFAPLHVNREARVVWLQRLSSLEKYEKIIVTDQMSDGNSSTIASVTVRSTVPFVNYESDIFAVFGAWKLPQLVQEDGNAPTQGVSSIDPFAGLQRSEIRRVGLSELPHGLEAAVQALDIQRLPVMEEFSFVTLGPDLRYQPRAQPWQDQGCPEFQQVEMSVVDLQRIRCEIRDLDVCAFPSHTFFNEGRPRHQAALSPAIRPISRYTVYVKALLWHAYQGTWTPDLDSELLTEMRYEFLQYVFEGVQHTPCPLASGVCGLGGHGRGEMLTWEPDFDIRFKIMFETTWLSVAAEIGILL